MSLSSTLTPLTPSKLHVHNFPAPRYVYGDCVLWKRTATSVGYVCQPQLHATCISLQHVKRIAVASLHQIGLKDITASGYLSHKTLQNLHHLLECHWIYILCTY